MKRALVTGATGFAGHFVVENLLSAGYAIRAAARHKPERGFFSKPVEFKRFELDPDRDWRQLCADTDCLVHCAFDHVAGLYRGGEGDDPRAFRRHNLAGTIALFEAAKRAGVERAVFLSSRAVYGTHPAGVLLDEATEPRPDTLYGEVKLETERAIATMADGRFQPVSLRATGIYGPPAPGTKHKWHDLFAGYLSGEEVSSRIGTEVHGDDLAAAVRLVLEADAKQLTNAAHHGDPSGFVFNVSDILVDRHDLLAAVKAQTGCPHPLPPTGDPQTFCAMDAKRLISLGWRPRGRLDLSGII
jgi:nucleoside-diphosphate-sugar epimerase